MVKDESTPRMEWPLAIITEAQPDADEPSARSRSLLARRTSEDILDYLRDQFRNLYCCWSHLSHIEQTMNSMSMFVVMILRQLCRSLSLVTVNVIVLLLKFHVNM